MEVRFLGFGSIEVEGRTYGHDIVIDRGAVRSEARSPRSHIATSSATLRSRLTRRSPGADPAWSSAPGPMARCRSWLRWSRRPRAETLTLWLSLRTRPADWSRALSQGRSARFFTSPA